MVVKNRHFHELFADFSKCTPWTGTQPSDIDMQWQTKDAFIYGEIKNERGTFTKFQRTLYERMANDHRSAVFVLFIKHQCYVQHGDTEIDVSKAQVIEYYFKPAGETKGYWLKPKRPTTTKEAISKIERDTKWQTKNFIQK